MAEKLDVAESAEQGGVADPVLGHGGVHAGGGAHTLGVLVKDVVRLAREALARGLDKTVGVTRRHADENLLSNQLNGGVVDALGWDLNNRGAEW